MDIDLNEYPCYDFEESTYYSSLSDMRDDEIGSNMSIDEIDQYSDQAYGGHDYTSFEPSYVSDETTSPFWQRYQCCPASLTEKHAHIESSDKIIMPPSALDVLSSLQIDYPMLFELRPYYFDDDKNGESEKMRVSHCGVWEFTAEEGFIYMPNWMMQNMKLQKGDLVLLQNKTLPKGTHVKLQPHTKDFLDIPDPKAMLEMALKTFSCLTTGDTILLPYENKKYYMDIIETKPCNAIGITDTDCEVDFAPPLDYKEPEKPVAAASVPINKAVEEPKFSPFTGAGRRLDGKPLQYEPAAIASSFVAATNCNAQPCTGSSSQATSRRAQGKLVFGADANPASTLKAVSKDVKQQQQQLQEKEEPKFLPFTGKMYSLT
jgi:ubiquitin fusion degradation protein 1